MPSALSGCGEAPGIFQVHVGGLAGGVREQHAHGDPCALGIVLRIERGKDLLYGLVEVELALLVELHDGGCGGEALGERRHVEDGVLGHALGG